MAAIARLPLEIPADDVWASVARAAVRAASQADIALRDAIVLLPFAQLLAPARRAFAQQPGWQPRIETTQTLARALGPSEPAQVLQLSFDNGTDRLAAAQLLRSLPAGIGWSRAEPRAFERAVAAVVETAQALARRVAAIAPADRDAHWQSARQLLAPLSGPGERQRALARVALEWAALAPAPASDRLFTLAPSAWIVVQAGGSDPLAQALMDAAASATSCLLLDLDAVAPMPVTAPTQAVCDGFEHEAQAAAAQVLVHLAREETPVALIGADRMLVRRVRALLERHDVPLADETGWTLSTTRAAAQVMLLLRAAAARASTDALFEWLKVLPDEPGRADARAALRQLESHCRRLRLSRLEDLARRPPEGRAQRLWASANELLEPLRVTRLTMSRWLERLRAALLACRAWPALEADEAGRGVLQALRLSAFPVAAESLAAATLSLDEFVAWADAVLEGANFVPEVVEGAPPLVVITPLARAMLRPFAAVVCPGADDRHLGARAAPHPLLDDATLRALGLSTAQRRQHEEAVAFAQILQAPRLTFLRRRVDDGDPMADSPLVERLALDLAARGLAPVAWTDPRARIELAPTPVLRPSPVAPVLLPQQVSASAAEALRDCPYRFFSRHMLKLREDDELDGELEKREYGTWLHEVLLAFHRQRSAPAPAEVEQGRLRELAAEVQARQGLPDETFLPFAASFAAFVPRYVAWLHARDRAGATWQAGEQDTRRALDGADGIELYGVIDRIDRVDRGTGLELIDYKTGSAEGLRRKLREPQEDTQLAFYAALQKAHSQLPLRAMYLALDGTHTLEELPHPQVEYSAQRLLHGLADDFMRLRAGAGAPALGEGVTCEYCEARGLCRRDHWAEGGEP